MNAQSFQVIEIARPADRLRCYISGGRDGTRRVKARLLRGGKVVEENVFELDGRLPRHALIALLEKTMREIAAAAGGRLRVMRSAKEDRKNGRRRRA